MVLEPRGERAGQHDRPAGRSRRSRIGSPSLSWFLVSVPVLSVQRMSTPAISSMAASRETIAFCFESASAPSAMVIEKTAGIATGIEATSRTSTNCRIVERVVPAPVVRRRRCRGRPGRRPGRPRAPRRATIRKLPIWNIAFWAWLRAPAPATSLAVRPKKVWPPVAMTTPVHLALLDDAARVGLVADLLRHRQRLAGQRRLVDRGVVAGDQAQVRGDDRAEADLDDVAGDERRWRRSCSSCRRAARSPPGRGPSSAPRARSSPCDPARGRAPALKTSRPRMIAKSGQWPRIAETTAAASIMKAIGPMKQRSTFSREALLVLGMPFGPYLASRSVASAAREPLVGLDVQVRQHRRDRLLGQVVERGRRPFRRKRGRAGHADSLARERHRQGNGRDRPHWNPLRRFCNRSRGGLAGCPARS